MRMILACSVIVFAATMSLVAQAVHSPARKVISMPKTPLPEWDDGNYFGKSVRVAVTADEAGNVISVGDATGPGTVCPSVTRPDVLAIREKAKAIAAKARFEPNPDGATLSYVEIEFPAKPETKAKKGDEKVEQFMVAKSEPSTVNGEHGILNGKAISLPKPVYPPAARAVRAAGTVQMQVLIDEEGNVFSAEPLDGHPLLRFSARQAACGAKFAPVMLSGNPVKVQGVITYNFVP